MNELGYRPQEMTTGERTGAAKLKWVIAVDRSLPTGQAVNAAACVSAATAPAVPGLLGPGGHDGSGGWHEGLPWAGCSILGATSAELGELRAQAIAQDMLVTDMPAAAQATRVYDEYIGALAASKSEELALLAVSVIGPRNRVAKLVRPFGLLR
jgi:hypothetical protein